MNNPRNFCAKCLKEEDKCDCITMRDKFAMAALQGILISSYDKVNVKFDTLKHFTGAAYEFADAMMEARNK